MSVDFFYMLGAFLAPVLLLIEPFAIAFFFWVKIRRKK